MFGIDPASLALVMGQMGAGLTASDPTSWQHQFGQIGANWAGQQVRNQQLDQMLNNPAQQPVPQVGMGEPAGPGGIGGVGPQTMQGAPSTMADYNTAQLQGGMGGGGIEQMLMMLFGGMGGLGGPSLTPTQVP